jgi:hypothetical protein
LWTTWTWTGVQLESFVTYTLIWKKYEQCIIPPHAQNYLRLWFFCSMEGVEMVTFMTLITSLYSKIEIE